MPKSKPSRPVRRPADYILTSRTSFPSARALRDAIERLTGRHYYITNKPGIATNCIARYGGNITVPGRDWGLNSVERIACLGSKAHFARTITHEGMPYEVPTFHTSGEPTEFPVLIRETLTGYGGRGIHIVHNLAEFRSTMRQGWWWVQYYKFDSEYRVHVAGGQILRVFEKVRSNDLPAEEFPIRNSDRGYHFSLVERPLFGESLRRAVAYISTNFELFADGFFALDIGCIRGSTRQNRPARTIIIEGNSAPGLTENDTTADMYAGYIVDFLGLTRLNTVPSVVRTEPVPTPTPAPVRRPAVPTAAETINRIAREERDAQVNPTVTPERRTNEVLRPASNSERTGLPNTGNSGRTQHSSSSGSGEWSW